PDVQRIRVPLRPGRRRAVTRRLVEGVLSRLHLRGPRVCRPAAPPRPARPADARVRPGAGLRVRRHLDRCLEAAGQPETIFTGVPTRTSLRSARTSLLRRRTQPCDTAWPMSHGVFVPWTPTTPPPGQSDSFE